MKKMAVLGLLCASFTLTGCIEELLASFCKRLASNNSIITVFQTSNPATYQDKFVKLTYTNVDTSKTENQYTVTDCNGGTAFNFPDGERRTSSEGIAFVSVLDELGSQFFSGFASTDKYTVKLEWFDSTDPDCTGASTVNEIDVPNAQVLTWEEAMEIPPELGFVQECTITGQSAILYLAE